MSFLRSPARDEELDRGQPAGTRAPLRALLAGRVDGYGACPQTLAAQRVGLRPGGQPSDSDSSAGGTRGAIAKKMVGTSEVGLLLSHQPEAIDRTLGERLLMDQITWKLSCCSAHSAETVTEVRFTGARKLRYVRCVFALAKRP